MLSLGESIAPTHRKAHRRQLKTHGQRFVSISLGFLWICLISGPIHPLSKCDCRSSLISNNFPHSRIAVVNTSYAAIRGYLFLSSYRFSSIYYICQFSTVLYFVSVRNFGLSDSIVSFPLIMNQYRRHGTFLNVLKCLCIFPHCVPYILCMTCCSYATIHDKPFFCFGVRLYSWPDTVCPIYRWRKCRAILHRFSILYIHRNNSYCRW